MKRALACVVARRLDAPDIRERVRLEVRVPSR
jgi:hypothetical protein